MGISYEGFALKFVNMTKKTSTNDFSHFVLDFKVHFLLKIFN